MATQHVYGPLPADEYTVRLLKILPGQDADFIAVQLQNVSLLDAEGTYDAISYMWGSPDKTHQIWVGNATITVRDNIWQFLQHYRDNPLEDKAKFLWIDSICINQQNLEEKGLQVAGMGQVFSKARQVLIWLNGISEITWMRKQDIEFLRQVYDQTIPEETSEKPYPTYLKEHQTSRKILEMSDLANPEDPTKPYSQVEMTSADRIWDLTLNLSIHPYWQRLWIVQETTLARGGPKLILGASVIGGDVIGIIKHMVPLPDEDDLTQLQGYAAFNRLCPRTGTGAGDFASEVRTSSITSLVHFYCLQLCTDPRDGIYGLIGLVDPTLPIESLKIDYKIDVWILFLQVLDLLLYENEDRVIPTHMPEHLTWITTLAWALEVQSEHIQALLLKSDLPSPSAKRNTAHTLQALSTAFKRSLQSPGNASGQQLLQQFVHCKINVSVSAPRQRLHQDPRRFFMNSYSNNLPGCKLQLETDLVGWKFRYWLHGKLQSLWLIAGQLWTCSISNALPLAFRPLPNGKLEVVGYVYSERRDAPYKLTKLPSEIHHYTQSQFDDNIEHIKDSWSRGERTNVSFSILQLMQLGELGRKIARGFNYGDGLLSLTRVS